MIQSDYPCECKVEIKVDFLYIWFYTMSLLDPERASLANFFGAAVDTDFDVYRNNSNENFNIHFKISIYFIFYQFDC
jgi:hypothetical protein